MNDFLFQIFLFILGIIAEIRVYFLSDPDKKRLLRVLGFLLIVISLIWFGIKWGSKFVQILSPIATPKVKFAMIEAASFPFQPSKVNIEAGDTLEFSVEGDNVPTWYCGGGSFLSADGQYDPERQKSVFYTPANFCSLIGYIEGNEQGRQYFQIGISETIRAEISGILYLGTNGSPPDKCALEDPQECYKDNTGAMNVKIQVTHGK
jgi:hypothetical protein